jgi:hypothetical protein
MEGNVPIEVSIQLTPNDLRDLWRNSVVRYLSWFLIAIGIYLAYFVFAEVMNQGFSSETASTIIWNGTVALVAFLVGLFFDRLRARQMIRNGPTLRELRRYRFSATGVHFDAELMTCDFGWGSFFSIVESRRSFLLYLSPLFGIVIPKAHLSTADEVSRLRDLFRNYSKGKLKLRG